MTARETESALLERCIAIAQGTEQAARNAREANVFGVAGMLIRSRFAAESNRLMGVSEQYFSTNPGERVESAEVVRLGWVVDLPRQRDMLFHRL